ncbi:hypothetical protein F4553_001047 [Allocatelliglobosispora scoriae]|uniref:DUF998 domain-containing protein n=1 Tax=Allocatelliglobosispora scoriae TaxID=643052 RepID=A0A841BK01_9ACTN|nr:DUF998 domain-containing protein [Allocatelliglobosispora scoriae]MBB5867668.1 hypothetical protein [Allocatelliglobosispora scoriae]
MRRRGTAAAAFAAGATGLVGLAVAVWPHGVHGYVSESGVPGTARADLYLLSIVLIAVAAALLAGALWPVCRQAGALLLAAAPAIGLSGAVTCTDGCPLPPYDPTTAQDLLHAGASIAGVGFSALAMLAVAWWPTGRLRPIARAGVAVAWPVLVATAACMVFVGRSGVTGVLERLGLLACVAWMLATAVAIAVDPPRPG